MGTPITGTTRVPFPHCIVDDVGWGFAFATFGGSPVYFLKGLHNYPRGERFVGATQTVRMNVPRLGGRCAVWSGLFSAVDCSLVSLRNKEDPWNDIVAGAAASGLLRVRKGLRVATRYALAGGLVMALFEGLELIYENWIAGAPPPVIVEDLPAEARRETAAATSWFGNLFGGGKREEK